MSKERAETLQKLLETNIELFLASGGKLVYGSYGEEKENCACALNTVLVNAGEKVQELGYGVQGKELRQSFSRLVGTVFYFDELLSVVRGFDDFGFSPSLLEEFYELGAKLREKYNPVHIPRY